MLDLRPLLLLVAAVDLMVAGVLLVGAGRRLKHGTGLWIISLPARALAVAILLARVEPQSAALAVSSALLALSMTLQAAALLAYEGRRLPAWVHTAAMAGAAAPPPPPPPPAGAARASR